MLSKRIFVLVSLLLVSFLLVGCGLTTPDIVDNQAPVITSTPVTEAKVGEAYTYDVEATDPDGDTITYSLISNISGMEIDEDTGLITWTPNSAGSFGVKVMVSDGVLSDTQSFTITVTSVAELTEIVVTPDTMDLEVGGTGTFQVIAYYNDTTKDVTLDPDCVYEQLTTGVITVTASSVTADGVGADTIFISYTENGVTATANISITVSRAREPMEIIVDLPTFTVGGPYWFTVKMLANDDEGKSVKASFGWPISTEEVKIAGILETDVASDVNFTLEGDVFQTEEFTMEDTIIVNFRGTFTSPGTYLTTIEVKTSPGDDLLCSEYIEIVVEAVKVGNSYGGGVVAYILQPGESNGVYNYNADIQHGLIAATADQSEGIFWHATSDGETGATATALGTGNANTNTIVTFYGIESNAAKLCLDYTNADTGTGIYSDWFLPSKDELSKLYDNRVAIGGFAEASYWSSSEYMPTFAYTQIFTDDGTSSYGSKSGALRVRAVRAF